MHWCSCTCMYVLSPSKSQFVQSAHHHCYTSFFYTFIGKRFLFAWFLVFQHISKDCFGNYSLSIRAPASPRVRVAAQWNWMEDKRRRVAFNPYVRIFKARNIVWKAIESQQSQMEKLISNALRMNIRSHMRLFGSLRTLCKKYFKKIIIHGQLPRTL